MRRAVTAAYDRIEPAAVDIDPTLRKPVQSARQHAITESQEMEKKLVHHLKRRQETELSQIERARTALLPGGKPQERVLNVVPFLARYGSGLLTELVTAIRAWYARRAADVPGPP